MMFSPPIYLLNVYNFDSLPKIYKYDFSFEHVCKFDRYMYDLPKELNLFLFQKDYLYTLGIMYIHTYVCYLLSSNKKDIDQTKIYI